MIRLIFFMLLAPSLAAADPVTLRLLPGWRDGPRHIAGLEIDLAPGWKTYWRAPGDAGIPPQLNLPEGAEILFPTPKVMDILGARVIGYDGPVVLPLVFPAGAGPLDVSLTAQLGICDDICVPVSGELSARLPQTATRDPALVAALAMLPQEAGGITCDVAPMDGGLRLTVTAPEPLHRADTVIEVADPMAWVSEPTTDGHSAVAEVYGDALALDRAGVRLTVMRDGAAVDYLGCD